MSAAETGVVSIAEVRKELDAIQPTDGLEVNRRYQRANKLSGIICEMSLEDLCTLTCEGLAQVNKGSMPGDIGDFLGKLRGIRSCIDGSNGSIEFGKAGPLEAVAVSTRLLENTDLEGLHPHQRGTLHNHLRATLRQLLN